MTWMWYFLIYSFCGFLLEVAFARIMGHPKRDRKCFLLLPMCPVYGLGALLILWLARPERGILWVMVMGALAATAAELLMGLFYRHVLKVEFWDYSDMRGNLAGLVCPMFSLFWAILSLGLVYWVHPWVTKLVAAIPGWLTPPALILLGADALVSSVALRRAGTTEVLRWYATH